MSRFFLSFLFFCLVFCHQSFAESDLYTVENVAVSSAGKSPHDAKNIAVSKARRDALTILLSRLEIGVGVVGHISNDEVSDMVRSEQISDERIAGNNYSAAFKIIFAQDFVEHILAQKNTIQVADPIPSVQNSYLLIPVKISENQPILWEEENDWKKSITRTIDKKSLSTKFLVPESDINNLSLINRDNVAIIGYPELEPMLTHYKATAAYNMFFSFDEIENKVSINVFYISKSQKKQFKLSFINVNHLSYNSLIDKVSEKVLDYLVTSQNKSASSIFHIQIPTNNLVSWLGAKNKIETSGLVTQLNIESISRDFAVISVSYNNEAEIADSFSRIGVLLEKKSDNFYHASFQ